MTRSRSIPPPPARPDLVVTGLGIWSAAGVDPATFLTSALEGNLVARSEYFDGQAIPVCRAPTPPAPDCYPAARRLDRIAQLALAAALPAAEQAKLGDLPPHRVAILAGNSRGPVGTWSAPQERGRVRPTRAANSAVASLSGALSLALHLRGPCLTVSATCASAAHAVALGAVLVRSGMVDAALVGGAEAPLVAPMIAQFTAAGILGSHLQPEWTCRPFDVSRNGTVAGEGAGFLVVESAAHAASRGVVPLARLAGWGLGAESHSRAGARPDGAGLAQVMHDALALAGLRPGDVEYVNAHGTGTVVNDVAEAAALRAVFGVPGPWVSSTKAVTGHTFGAAAALEAILCVLALKAGQAPPSAACADPDPALGIRLALGRPVQLGAGAVMSTSLGFWGNTAALVFARAER